MKEFKCWPIVKPECPIAEKFWQIFEKELRKVLTGPDYSWDIKSLNYTTLVSYCKWPSEYKNLYDNVLVYETNKAGHTGSLNLAYHAAIQLGSETLILSLVIIPKT